MFMFALLASVKANPVSQTTAQTIAENFYLQQASKTISGISLFYSETKNIDDPAYFVFNINSNDGFVIVSGDDAAYPIIGYSTEGKFVLPQGSESAAAIQKWLSKRVDEINFIRSEKIIATEEIANEWNLYATKQKGKTSSNNTTASVSPLLKTTWDQSPYYNDQCPGGSLTGCTATAMAQIMKFWSFPTMGTGSSSYCDCTSQGFTKNYGTLSANYGAATYSWSSMPNNVSTSNTYVAALMYHCGVSVEMDYSPDGSGSWVITADDTVCAQTSYVTYFGYDPATIQGLVRQNYSDNAWTTLLKNELDNSRPIQYVGDDPNNGGHTWVCDGYDASSNFHMNWGWGGYDNGYFSINSLSPGTYNFSDYQEALIGIQPKIAVAIDAGIQSVLSPTGLNCNTTFSPEITLTNYGTSTLTSCKINYTIDNGTTKNQSWTGSLASNQSTSVTLNSVTTTSGSHTLTCYSSNPNGSTDGNSANDLTTYSFYVNSVGATLPATADFESITSLPTGWDIYNPDGDAEWQINTSISHNGTQCVGFNNCDGNGSSDMTGTLDRLYTTTYDFSSATTAAMDFDVAYAPCSYQSVLYNDTLLVYYSIDCGSTWSQLYSKGGSTLATAPAYKLTSTSGCWEPSSSQWRLENISLNSLAGQSNVMFAFENRSDWGEWIYLDDINITSSTVSSISDINELENIEVYPNPASTSITIEGFQYNGKVHYVIADVSGKQVKNGEIKATNNGFKEGISVGDLSHGMYFLKLSDEKNTWVRKINVE